MVRFTVYYVCFFIALITMGNVVNGERRGGGTSPSAQYSAGSWQEQALLGSCNAEDCILGGNGSHKTSYFRTPYNEEVIPVSKSEKKVITVDENTTEEETKQNRNSGFGNPPAFTQHN